ncbi:GDP-mannose 4,6-dehydratase [Rhizobacter sp. OV335]|uniref:GDP-mannose 4,6-dehydratase n=1 Tax=Rhizobacter sp. OV335 TaxID=1500264 RepID=UPI000913EDBD|nr:GDP-mannose 4,6-dehydratase [Rhizobacter sp. OV335]SHL95453.1 UDP-glucose 4-epimerase [Rhizobacter sp. OV335]
MSANAPRVLVTGLNGFTGQHLASVLQRAGYEVHGTIRSDEAPDATHHVADLSDMTALRAVIDRVAPRHVVHLAAISFVAHDDADAIYRTNIVGTRNLLRALSDSGAVAAGLGTVLLASSANIYGNALVDPITEEQPAQPANDYAVSKSAMEQMAALWTGKLPITVVRPFNYTGAGQSKQFLIPKIVDAFARRAESLELGNLDVDRDFSDVRDVVEAYGRLLEASPRGTFNVCSERGCSLREVLRLVSDLSGHEIDVRVNPAFVRANEVKSLRGSAARLRALLPDWQSRPLRDTLDWMLQQAPP